MELNKWIKSDDRLAPPKYSESMQTIKVYIGLTEAIYNTIYVDRTPNYEITGVQPVVYELPDGTMVAPMGYAYSTGEDRGFLNLRISTYPGYVQYTSTAGSAYPNDFSKYEGFIISQEEFYNLPQVHTMYDGYMLSEDFTTGQPVIVFHEEGSEHYAVYNVEFIPMIMK